MSFSEFVKDKTNMYWDDYRDSLEKKGLSDSKIDEIQNNFLNEYYSYCEKNGIEPELFYKYSEC